MRFTIILIMMTKVVIFASAQSIGITNISELQYSSTTKMKNLCNLLRSDIRLPIYRSGEINFSSLHIYKLKSEGIINDLMTFSNIEEENSPFSLAILGYQQQFGASSFFIGVRNMNEDYFNTYLTSLFTNSSCGIYPTLSTNYAVANYPLSSLCFHFYMQGDRFGVKNSIYNGRGYGVTDKSDNPFKFNYKKYGILGIIELNYQKDDEKYFAGLSVHNNVYMHNQDNEWQKEIFAQEKKSKTSITWWLYTEQILLSKKKNELNLLLQYSENSAKTGFCKRYAGVGLINIYSGNKGLKHDLGIICTGAQFSGGYEIDTEVTVSYKINNIISLQPAAHIIKNNIGFHTAFLFRIISSIDCNLRKNN